MLDDAQLVAFTATRRPASARGFYEGVLGLRLVSADDYALVFDAHGTTLRVQVVAEHTPHPVTALGWTVSDIEQAVAGLTARGVSFARFDGLEQCDAGIWRAPGGAKVAWFADPDGNLLSVTQPA